MKQRKRLVPYSAFIPLDYDVCHNAQHQHHPPVIRKTLVCYYHEGVVIWMAIVLCFRL